MVITKLPDLKTAPPELPPYLQRKGKPGRRIIIVPDISLLHVKGSTTHLKDHTQNWITILYGQMCRVTIPEGGSFLGSESKWEGAHSSTRLYRSWLETYQMEDGIPPHISFGGAIEPFAEGDPTFFSRWKAWARETFF